MAKIKTVRSVNKRFKRTASGRFKRKRANLRHLLTKKSTNRKRHLRQDSMLSKEDFATVIRCLPYA